MFRPSRAGVPGVADATILMSPQRIAPTWAAEHTLWRERLFKQAATAPKQKC